MVGGCIEIKLLGRIFESNDNNQTRNWCSSMIKVDIPTIGDELITDFSSNKYK